MSTPLHAMLTGTFTSDGAARNLALPSGYDSIELINLTDIGSAAAATPVMKARGTSSMAAGAAYYSTKTNGAATVDLETTTATNGFTFVADSGSQALGPAVTNITAITAASPAVASTATPAAVGQVVRVYGTTGMLQLSGLDLSVTAVAAGVSMTFGYVPAVTWAAPATAGSWRVVPFDPRFYPRSRYITAITAANPAVVTCSVTHGFVVGEKVRLIVPAAFGMTQMNGLLGTITAISTANNTVTLDIDSSAFTAFAYPTSAVAALGVTFPQIIPIGEAAQVPYQNLLDDATRNLSATGVVIGTACQTTGKVYQWIARKGLSI